MKTPILLSKLIFILLLTIACSPTEQSSRSDNAASNSSASNRLPNIVVVFTDDQGYQDLGCFGSPNIKTPNIDKMAAGGAKFTNFYVSQPVCSASRASLLTGCYANRVGVSGAFMPYVGKGLNLEEETIAEILKPLGYATGIFGKWHLGSETELLPTRQGFDEYFGIPYSNDMWPNHPQQGPVFDFSALPLFDGEVIIDTLEEQSMLTTHITERAVDFIDKHKEKPFFLYVPHPMPHVPLFVSDKYAGKSEAGIYGDVISEIDWSVGQILSALEKNGLRENTLVVFTSDNGPWLNYGTHSGVALPLREGKGTSLEGGVRVPCVMSWPGKIKEGQVINKPAMTIDLMPTIAKITGANLPVKKIDGIDMSYLMMDGEEAKNQHHDAYYFYYKQNELHGILSGDGRWKLYLPHSYRSINGRVGTSDGLPINYTYDNKMDLELYDLVNDISETINVSEANPEMVESLLVHAEQARKDLGDKLTDRIGNENRPVGVVNEK